MLTPEDEKNFENRENRDIAMPEFRFEGTCLLHRLRRGRLVNPVICEMVVQELHAPLLAITVLPSI